MLQCVQGKKNYWIKTHNAFQNLTHVQKCHYENENNK